MPRAPASTTRIAASLRPQGRPVGEEFQPRETPWAGRTCGSTPAPPGRGAGRGDSGDAGRADGPRPGREDIKVLMLDAEHLADRLMVVARPSPPGRTWPPRPAIPPQGEVSPYTSTSSPTSAYIAASAAAARPPTEPAVDAQREPLRLAGRPVKAVTGARLARRVAGGWLNVPPSGAPNRPPATPPVAGRRPRRPPSPARRIRRRRTDSTSTRRGSFSRPSRHFPWCQTRRETF